MVDDIEDGPTLLEVHKSTWCENVHMIGDGEQLWADNDINFIVAPLPTDPSEKQPTVTWYANGTYERHKQVLDWKVGSHFRLPPYSRIVVTGGSVSVTCIYGEFKFGEEGKSPTDKPIWKLLCKERSSLTPAQKKAVKEMKSRNWHRMRAKTQRKQARSMKRLERDKKRLKLWNRMTDEEREEHGEEEMMRHAEEEAVWKRELKIERAELRKGCSRWQNIEFDDIRIGDMEPFKPGFQRWRSESPPVAVKTEQPPPVLPSPSTFPQDERADNLQQQQQRPPQLSPEDGHTQDIRRQRPKERLPGQKHQPQLLPSQALPAPHPPFQHSQVQMLPHSLPQFFASQAPSRRTAIADLLN